MRRTADDVLLTCWPPAPLARKTSMRMSASLTSRSGSSITGHTCTAAKLVWRRPWLSNGLMRTSRCVPRSAVIRPYAYRPVSVNSADMMPGLGALADAVDLVTEATPLGPAAVHPQQDLGPVLGVDAAVFGVDLHDAIGLVVLAGEQAAQVELVELLG